MTARSFYDKLLVAQTERESDLALLLSPRIAKMPLPIARYDDPFLPFGKAIIEATRDLVCGYMFDLASYLAIGAAGAVALERTIAYARADSVTITVLHAPFASRDFAEAASDRAFAVDAVTLVNAADAGAYLVEPGKSAFVVSEEGTPETPLLGGAGMLQARARQLIAYAPNKPPRRVRVLGESILYIDSREDFDQHVRAAVSAERAVR